MKLKRAKNSKAVLSKPAAAGQRQKVKFKIPKFSLRKFSIKRVFGFYRGMTIFKKLSASFLAVAVVGNVVIGLVAILNLNMMMANAQKQYKEDLEPLSPLHKIETEFLKMNTKLTGGDMETIMQRQSEVSAIFTDLTQYLSVYAKTVKDDDADGKKALSQMTDDISTLSVNISQVFSSFMMEDSKAANDLISGDIAKTSNDFEKLVNGLFEKKTNEAKKANDQNSRDYMMALIVMGGVTVLLIAGATLMGRMNAKLISKPINSLVKSAEAISNGDLDIVIEKGDGDEVSILAHAFEKIVASLNLLKKDIGSLIGGAVDGNLLIRANVSDHKGAYGDVIGGVNTLLDTITVPLNTAADYIDAIGRGEIPAKIEDVYKGDFNRIKNNLNLCIDSINALIADAEMLSVAAVEGNLSVRADAARHNGDYRKIIEGVNGTLDAITAPLSTAAEYIDAISRGAMPAQITDDFKGDFNLIRQNLNTCIDSINALIADAGMLSDAALRGDLSVRADTDRHQGDFKKIIEGVNDTLSAVVNPLQTAEACITRISRGDIPEKLNDEANGEYKVFQDSINTCIDAVNLLIADANLLSEAANRGDLKVRADAGRHEGDFRKIIEGVNSTLESVIAPVREAQTVLAELAKGNLGVEITGEYKGDLSAIKESINTTTAAWSEYINEISAVLSQMSDGNLDVEITSDYKGDFVRIKESINLIISTFNDAIREILFAADGITASSRQVSQGSQSLSAGASEQAASIEQLNASMSEIAKQTRENALSAANADKIAASVRGDAETGTDKMNAMLTSMNEISESSANISKIIRVIDDIAFQTNILSLNAAIEAARAGQYGKGFAVVADEVRRLAARSAEAAKDTTEMIEKSIEKATEGTGIARNTSGALKQIEDGVRSTADIIRRISESSNEQATGISQINKGIDQVSKIVQTNSATSEESAAASEELFSQAESLRTLVGRFKLKQE